ncbi:hypothetical protein MNBD_GAMMA03-1016 [hydrothermal vent metagenome]|uniref:Flagellar protein FliT n=1 Tax=hydrothermal vent metagenome TaxID=652676 RepID=A0A3B0WUF3_9ZZZZ
MDSLEMIKLQLLSHSKNMLNAAQKKDWDRFAALESSWMTLLQHSVSCYGNQLMKIGEELIKDNQKIQACVASQQKKLLKELDKNTKNISSIKSYLK